MKRNFYLLALLPFCLFALSVGCKKEDAKNFTCGTSTIKDCQGNVYNTVQIGTQCWIKQNMKATKYDNSSKCLNIPIPTSTSADYSPYFTPSTLSHVDAGLLYNWAAAVGLENGKSQRSEFNTKRQGICPIGWHIPTVAEWTILSDYLGGEDIAGGKMKTTGTSQWNFPNTDATNSSGFSGLPAGRPSGRKVDVDGLGDSYWSASAYDEWNASWTGMYYESGGFYRPCFGKDNALSVRCLKD